jgi:hypothetical protein
MMLNCKLSVFLGLIQIKKGGKAALEFISKLQSNIRSLADLLDSGFGFAKNHPFKWYITKIICQLLSS